MSRSRNALAFLLFYHMGLVFHPGTANMAMSAPLPCPETLDFSVRALAGTQPIRLCDLYAGKVIVVVNTASKCGFTPQYDGLEALYRKYKDRGLVVLGFPSNDFAGQEPGSEQQIQSFCRLTYGVQFPMFQKTQVIKSNADPLYATLGKLAGEFPAWNFHKYVLNREGKIAGSFKSQVEPGNTQFIRLIESLL